MRFVSGGCDNLIKEWVCSGPYNKFSGEIIGNHEDWVRDVSYANNIGLPSDMIASCSEDHSV